jgi:hypothetical protein
MAPRLEMGANEKELEKVPYAVVMEKDLMVGGCLSCSFA